MDAGRGEGEGGDSVREEGRADGGVVAGGGEGFDEGGAAGGDPARAEAGEGVGF